jgi:hypothetical protein
MTLYVKKTMLWSIANREYHPYMVDEEKSIGAHMPLIAKLFPGINYYSISGFGQVYEKYLVPTIHSLFPELKGVNHSDVFDDPIEIKELLPCKGYEHEDDPNWGIKLQKILKKLPTQSPVSS